MVDAAILRQRINCFHPIAFQPVDAVTGAQRLGTRQLFIAAGGHIHLGAVRFGDLQREQRHPAGALHQHRLAGMQFALLHQREPGG